MIDTSQLDYGDVCVVHLDNGEKALSVFKNGVFQNIENTHHRNEVYGSSVTKFTKKYLFCPDCGDVLEFYEDEGGLFCSNTICLHALTPVKIESLASDSKRMQP